MVLDQFDTNQNGRLDSKERAAANCASLGQGRRTGHRGPAETGSGRVRLQRQWQARQDGNPQSPVVGERQLEISPGFCERFVNTAVYCPGASRRKRTSTGDVHQRSHYHLGPNSDARESANQQWRHADGGGDIAHSESDLAAPGAGDDDRRGHPDHIHDGRNRHDKHRFDGHNLKQHGHGEVQRRFVGLFRQFRLLGHEHNLVGNRHFDGQPRTKLEQSKHQYAYCVGRRRRVRRRFWWWLSRISRPLNPSTAPRRMDRCSGHFHDRQDGGQESALRGRSASA